MQLFKYIDRINLLDKLIRQRRTGTSQELARIIEYMRDMDAPFEYDRISMTYYYTQDYSIQIRIEIQDLSHQQMRRISGGYFFAKSMSNAVFMHWTGLI